jgi:hypothetical protein
MITKTVKKALPAPTIAGGTGISPFTIKNEEPLSVMKGFVISARHE